MCAHKVIGMSIIGLTCASVVASTFVKIGPETELISTLADVDSGCDPRIVHHYQPLPPAEAERRRALIVGKWRGTVAVEDGPRRRFVAEHLADGTFRMIVGRVEADDQENIEQRNGRWGTSGPIFFTTVTRVSAENGVAAANPGDPANYNAFEVLKINDEYFEFESFSPRARYVARRLGDDANLEEDF